MARSKHVRFRAVSISHDDGYRPAIRSFTFGSPSITNIQTSVSTTMNRDKPADDRPTQENEVAPEATYGGMLAEWGRTVATLLAVNRVLLASGQRLISHQMELSQNIARDIMTDPQGDLMQRSSRRAIAHGAELGSLLHGSNCEIAEIVVQHLVESMHGLTASVERALALAR